MKKLILLILLLPLFVKAQVSAPTQKIISTGVIRANAGSNGLDTLINTKGAPSNGQLPQYSSALKAWVPYTIPIDGATGIISGGTITGLGGANAIVASGTGTILDNTSPSSPALYELSWITDTIGLADNATNYLYYDSLGVLNATTTIPNPANFRTRVYLGRAQKASGVITSINGAYVPIQQAPASIKDMFTAYGLTKTGLVVSPASTNLTIAIASGGIFSFGANFQSSVLNPNNLSYTANSPQTFRMVTAGNISSTDITVLPVGSYNPTGTTISAIGGGANESTIFTVYKFPTTGNVRILYGQTTYASLTAAVQAIGSYVPNPPAVFSDAIIIGYIAAVKTATDLSNTAQAVFVTTNKFGGVGGGFASTALTNYMQTDFSNKTAAVPISTTTISNGGTTNGISYASDIVRLHKVTATTGGVLTTGADTIAGNKILLDSLTINKNPAGVYSSSLRVGTGTGSSTQTGVQVSMQLNDALAVETGHGFSDATEFAVTGMSYNSYDARPLFSGSATNRDHYTGFQFGPSASSTSNFTDLSFLRIGSNLTNINAANFYGLNMPQMSGTAFTNKYVVFSADTSAIIDIGGKIKNRKGGIEIIGTSKFNTTSWPTSAVSQAIGRMLVGSDAFTLWNKATPVIGNKALITLGSKFGSDTSSLSGAILRTNLKNTTTGASELEIFTATSSSTNERAVRFDENQNTTFDGQILDAVIPHRATAADSIQVLDNGKFAYRTPAEMLSDLNALPKSAGSGQGLTGSLYSNITSNDFLNVTTATTSRKYGLITNTGGYLIFGVEPSTGGGIAAGSAAYSSTLGTSTATDLNLITNGVIRQKILSTGATEFSGNISAANLASGTYTPTLTGVSNVTSSIANSGRYIRVGNQVIVYNHISVTPTATTTDTSIRITLPIGATLGSTTAATGSGTARSTNDSPLIIIADTVNNEALLYFKSSSTSAHGIDYSFAYTIP